MKNNYIKPTVKVKPIEPEQMLSASVDVETKSTYFENDESLELNAKGSAFGSFTDEASTSSGIDWDE